MKYKQWIPIAVVVIAAAGFLVFGLSNTAPPAEAQQQSFDETKLAAWFEQKFTETQHKDRVIQLPEDGAVWYFSAVYTNARTDEPSRRVAAMIASTPRLQSLKAQTKFNEFAENNQLYVYRYRSKIGGEVPAIFVQDSSGKVIYKCSGLNIPMDGESLADEISAAIEQCRPQPSPDVRPTVNPVSVIPDIRPNVQPADEGTTASRILGGLLSMIPMVLAAWWKQRQA